MTLLQALIEYAKVQGQPVEDGVNAFRDFLPDEPDDCIALFEYLGDPVSPFIECRHRSVQVVCRAADADAAREKAFDIQKIFEAETESLRIDFTDTLWGQVYIRQSPFKLDQDEQNRVLYGFNLGITTNIVE